MFIPQAGAYLTIQLPGEVLRAIVEKTVTSNSAIVKIVSQPLAKSHTYKKDDIVACRRQKTMLGEQWEVVDEAKPTIESLEKQELENAAASGKRERGTQHKRNDKIRPPKKSSDSSKSRKRKKASKSK